MSANACRTRVVGSLLVIALLTGCSGPQPSPATEASPSPATLAPTSQETARPPASAQANAAPSIPEHRIGTRVVDGIGEFYDRLTGQTFVPRGNNYIRLAEQQSTSGDTIIYHSTFNPGLYDPALAEEALERMHADGYNVTRLILNSCCAEGGLGDPAGGLSSAYLRNLSDFLQKAKANSIFTIIAVDDIPAVGGYIQLQDTTWSEDFAGTSASYLRSGGVLANAQFWRDLIEELAHRGAPLDAVFAYQLRNELFFESNLPPLSLSSGLVGTADGITYDMASEDDKQRMMDEGLIYWIDNLRAAILELDPTALVTVGFFPPDKPNPWPSAPRRIRTSPALWESSADFFDLHPYPGGYSLDKLVENFEMVGLERKPIIMGEFGASRSSYASAKGAARALHDWQVKSCEYGFDGWLLWTWDSDEQTDFYNALADGGPINQALAPANRPDPCETGTFPFFEYNLALGKPAQASRSLPDEPPEGAVDGSTALWWGAGAGPTQWVQIDLGEASAIGLIRLVVSQSPPGDTMHQLWAGSTVEGLTLLHVFEGYTVDDQVLEFRLEHPIEDIRFIRVVTKRSPSWVAWKEIEVLAP